jgi:hypothetical protein
MKSDRPADGAGPRGTPPLGLGPFASPTAPRDTPREVRATVPMPRPDRAPELPEPAAVEPHRGAQLSARDVAPAPRPPPALRALVGLRGAWPAPSLARLARRLGAPGAVLGAVAIVALAVTLRARSAVPAVAPKLPAGRTLGPPMASAAGVDSAPSMPEPRPSPATVSTMASAASAPRPAARAPRGPRAAAPSSAAHAPAKSDVLDPWRN